MLAFAGNSILCRIALRDTAIDPASFTGLRIVAGALTLWLLLRVDRADQPLGDWVGAMALFVYAACFSFAYIDLDAGAGALLLFGAVQLSMAAWGLLKRRAFQRRAARRPAAGGQWIGDPAAPGEQHPALGWRFADDPVRHRLGRLFAPWTRCSHTACSHCG